MAQQFFNIGGINTYVNPVANDGALIHSVNMVSFPYGAKTKRTGYSAFLGTPDNATIQSLWQFPFQDGTTQYVYRKSGSVVYYSAQGTGAWTVCGNGTVDANAHIGYAILDNTMIIGDGVGSTRHTTNGTSFTNTTLAPISQFFEIFQGRCYAMGTSSTLFYSVANDLTNWNLSGTSDSSSFTIPGAGKGSRLFKIADRLMAPKNSGIMYKWDGYNLIDMSTKYGPNAPYAIAKSEDFAFYPNLFGIYGFGGAKPQLLSNAIQRQFYNKANTGISGTAFSQMPGEVHIYDYIAAVGSFTDDFTSRTLTNGIIKYDFQKNEFLNYDLAHAPTSFLSYTDINGVQQLIFGGPSGQVYKFDTTTTDAGSPINAEMVFIYNFKQPEYDKKWNWFRGIFNPGCQAKVQIACADTYTYSTLKWIDLGDVTDGVIEYKFPAGSRSKLLFVRIYEASNNAQFTYYGCSIDAQVQLQV